MQAIVTWRTADELTLIAFYPLCTDAVTKFRQFFKAEVSIHIAMMTDEDVKLERNDAETPLRIAATASTAAASARERHHVTASARSHVAAFAILRFWDL